MKSKAYQLIVVTVALLLGWVLGYLRVPYIELAHPYWLGAFVCLAIIAIAFFVSRFRNHSSLSQSPQSAGVIRGQRSLSIALLVVGTCIAGFMIVEQRSLQGQLQDQNEQIIEQMALIESLQQSSATALLGNLLNKIDDELSGDTAGTLSDATILRISAVSASLKPHRILRADTLSEQTLSPQRGELLTALAILELDSTVFARIKREADFSKADLRGVNLREADLSGIDLHGADLSNADLRGANLRNAILRETMMWGAKLQNSILAGANMKNARVQWANFNGADMRRADLNGGKLANAQLRKVDFSYGSLKWADLEGAIFTESNMTRMNFFGTAFKRANLSGANLTQTNLRNTNFSQATLLGAILFRSEHDAGWLAQLDDLHVTGAEDIQHRYQAVKTDTPFYTNAPFRLEKREE